MDEALLDRALDERMERIEVSGDVEDADRLRVETELRPRDDLEELLEHPEPTRQGDEAVRERGHFGLPLVHARDDAQLGHAVVCDLLRRERTWDDAHDLAARR